MARITNRGRTKGRGCTGKQRHARRTGAEQAAEWAISRGTAPERVDIYPCRHCDGWHTGHTSRGKR